MYLCLVEQRFRVHPTCLFFSEPPTPHQEPQRQETKFYILAFFSFMVLVCALRRFRWNRCASNRYYTSVIHATGDCSCSCFSRLRAEYVLNATTSKFHHDGLSTNRSRQQDLGWAQICRRTRRGTDSISVTCGIQGLQQVLVNVEQDCLLFLSAPF